MTKEWKDNRRIEKISEEIEEFTENISKIHGEIKKNNEKIIDLEQKKRTNTLTFLALIIFTIVITIIMISYFSYNDIENSEITDCNYLNEQFDILSKIEKLNSKQLNYKSFLEKRFEKFCGELSE